MKNFIIILFFSLFASGCTSSFNFSVANVVTSKQKINAALEEITTYYGDTMPIDWEVLDGHSKEYLSQEFIPAWMIALGNALKKAELFNQSAAKKVRLLVQIKEVDVPLFASDFTTRILANYDLIDNSNNKILCSTLVESEETVPRSYSFLGNKRAIESINRAVRKNIRIFISNIQFYANKGEKKK